MDTKNKNQGELQNQDNHDNLMWYMFTQTGQIGYYELFRRLSDEDVPL